MEKSIVIITAILFFHISAFAQNSAEKKEISAIVSEKTVHTKTENNRNDARQKEAVYTNHSNDAVATATTIYKELLPVFIMAVKKTY